MLPVITEPHGHAPHLPSAAHRRWRIAAICFAVLWLATAGVLGYQVMDLGDQIEDLSNTALAGSATMDLLTRVTPLLAHNTNRDELVAMLRQLDPSAFVVVTDSSVAISQLTFRFDHAGALERVLPFYQP